MSIESLEAQVAERMAAIYKERVEKLNYQVLKSVILKHADPFYRAAAIQEAQRRLRA